MAEWHRDDRAVAQLRAFEGDGRAMAALLGEPGPGIGRVVEVASVALGRIAPGDWIALGDAAPVAALVDRWNDGAVRGTRMAIDMSSAYACLALAGDDAHERLAAFCPLDLRDDRFGEGRIARSLLGATTAIFLRGANVTDEPRFTLLVDRTMLDYVEHLLAL